ncbi:hypothetical protein GCM10028809_52500 [Spirosoma gilvum]
MRIKLFFVVKRQRYAIHAIPEPGRGRAVVEDMAQVGVTYGTTNFSSIAVGFGINGVRDDGLIKTWPARMRIEFGS